MKKRVKLLTTIASLCLAVALMAFGVYAATNTTTSISSTVTFKTVDVLVSITGRVSLQGEDIATAHYDAKSYEDDGQPTKPGQTTALDLGAWKIADIEYVAGKTEVVYTLSVKNDSTVDKATVTLTGILGEIDGFTGATTFTNTYETDNATPVQKGTNYTDGTSVVLEPGKTVTYTLTRKIVDQTKSFSAKDSWNATLTCAKTTESDTQG